jgi:hypothetical protein
MPLLQARCRALTTDPSANLLGVASQLDPTHTKGLQIATTTTRKSPGTPMGSTRDPGSNMRAPWRSERTPPPPSGLSPQGFTHGPRPMPTPGRVRQQVPLLVLQNLELMMTQSVQT